MQFSTHIVLTCIFFLYQKGNSICKYLKKERQLQNSGLEYFHLLFHRVVDQQTGNNSLPRHCRYGLAVNECLTHLS